jgi:hypothetical protein
MCVVVVDDVVEADEAVVVVEADEVVVVVEDVAVTSSAEAEAHSFRHRSSVVNPTVSYVLLPAVCGSHAPVAAVCTHIVVSYGT